MPDNDAASFQDFITKYNKNYLTKDEYGARLGVFRANLALVRNHNPTKEGFALGLNKFADLSSAEFNAMQGFKAPNVEFHDGDVEPELLGGLLTANPTSVDWRTSGAVTGVKNQGSCGACYTFSAAAAMEGAYKIKGKALTDFSEQ